VKNTRLYYPELDSLRFLAFVLVLIHHSMAANTVRLWVTLHEYGWMGVDLFLSLSAFMFARLLFAEYEKKGDINIRYFYIRRALRIWPLYFFFFGLMLAYSIHLGGWSHSLLTRALGMATFTDNLFSMALGYNAAIAFSGHLWTISYEEQFYFIIPWALRILYRLDKMTVTTILAAAAVLGTLVRAVFIDHRLAHPMIWVFPLTHFESILGGLALGLGLFGRILGRIPGWIILIAGLMALWLVTTLPNVSDIQWKLMLTYPLVGIGMTLVLGAVLQGGLWPLSALLKSGGLRYLGKISYGLYVYHLAAAAPATRITNVLVSPGRALVYPAVGVAVRLIVTILISMISYHVLEKPFLRLKERFAFINSRPL
jgi:peptidoglycan/LPS O-acetylase OafA/YrhL